MLQLCGQGGGIVGTLGAGEQCPGLGEGGDSLAVSWSWVGRDALAMSWSWSWVGGDILAVCWSCVGGTRHSCCFPVLKVGEETFSPSSFSYQSENSWKLFGGVFSGKNFRACCSLPRRIETKHKLSGHLKKVKNLEYRTIKN